MPNYESHVSPPEFWPAATNSAAATRRTCATSGVWSREDHRGVARRRPHPGELVGGCGGVGAHRSKAHGGGRSSATCGRGVVVHGSGSGGLLRPPGVTRNTVTRAGVAGLGSCHRGTMAGGEELSGSTESAVRGRNRHRGESDSVRRLTARPTSAMARSGMLCSSRIDSEDPRRPTRGTAVLAASRGFRHHVAR